MKLVWLVFCTSLSLLGCRSAPTAVYKNPQRSQGLPEKQSELIHFADDLMPKQASAIYPSSADADRAVAALEKAHAQAGGEKFEIVWRLARANFYLCNSLTDKSSRLHYAAQGEQHAKQAIALKSERVEGYYFLALNMAMEAESRVSLSLVKQMVGVAERAAQIDPAFEEAGPLRLLGKTYLSAPSWPVSVGSSEKAVEMLERAVKLAPSPINIVFLGEAYFHDDQEEQAAIYLKRGMEQSRKSGLDPRWAQEAEEYLRRLSSGASSTSVSSPGNSSNAAND